MAACVAGGKDDGEAVRRQGSGARRVEVAGDEDKRRVSRGDGFRRLGKQCQHLLREVVDVGGAGAQIGVAQGGEFGGGTAGFRLPNRGEVFCAADEGRFNQLGK